MFRNCCARDIVSMLGYVLHVRAESSGLRKISLEDVLRPKETLCSPVSHLFIHSFGLFGFLKTLLV